MNIIETVNTKEEFYKELNSSTRYFMDRYETKVAKVYHRSIEEDDDLCEVEFSRYELKLELYKSPTHWNFYIRSPFDTKSYTLWLNK